MCSKMWRFAAHFPRWPKCCGHGTHSEQDYLAQALASPAVLHANPDEAALNDATATPDVKVSRGVLPIHPDMPYVLVASGSALKTST